MRGLEHFGIDCACKGNDGLYSGSHYKDADKVSEEIKRGYSPLGVSRFEHTFYLSEFLFLDTMKFREKDGLKPLIIVCNDCGREFPFTRESYFELKDRMGFEYNRKLSLHQLESQKDK